MSRVQHWSSAAFEGELHAWVEGVLGPVRLEVLKVRPWSTVWRAYAGGGLFFAKQNCPANRFEPGLAEGLASWVPAHVGEVAAIDRDRGFLLTPDQGDVLGIEHVDLDSWCGLVQHWAVVQRSLLDRELDVPELSVGSLVEVAEERVGFLAGLRAGDPRRLSDRGRHEAPALLRGLRIAREQVLEVGLPAALNHNDLHGGNVFRRSGRFFDFADALLGDPAGVLSVPLGIVIDHLGCAPDDPRVWRVADAWAEVWSDLCGAATLRRALPASMELARVTRQDAWWRALSDVREDETDQLGDFAGAAAEWFEASALPTPLRPA